MGWARTRRELGDGPEEIVVLGSLLLYTFIRGVCLFLTGFRPSKTEERIEYHPVGLLSKNTTGKDGFLYSRVESKKIVG